ncbi:MAG: hypothetical protein FWH04_08360 [Oscillospiraceae bacterium]|nr:hypothetical protein [Oscillospiraceae bacterium]
MFMKNKIIPLCLAAVLLLQGGCDFFAQPVQPATEIPRLFTQPTAPSSEIAVSTPVPYTPSSGTSSASASPRPISSGKRLLAVLPDEVFVRLDSETFTNIDSGDVYSVKDVYPAGDNRELVVVEKSSQFDSLGFISYYVALIDVTELVPVSDVLALPGTDLPKHESPSSGEEFSSRNARLLVEGDQNNFSLMYSLSQSGAKGKTYEAGFWRLSPQNPVWSMVWPEHMTYGDKGYRRYWKGKRAKMSVKNRSITVSTRPSGSGKWQDDAVIYFDQMSAVPPAGGGYPGSYQDPGQSTAHGTTPQDSVAPQENVYGEPQQVSPQLPNNPYAQQS